MKILALEFSPPERSIAVVINGEVRGFAIDRAPKDIPAFALISRVLKEAELRPADVECLAIGLGPGSYAGTRMAIAIAQGWELGRALKLIGLQSSEAIARLARRSGVLGAVNIVFDAQRNEAHAIRYFIELEQVRVLDSFRLLTPEVEAERREAGEIFVKGDRGPWGDANHATLFSDARVIGTMAEQRNDFLPGHALEPVYLRKAEFIKAPPARFSISGA